MASRTKVDGLTIAVSVAVHAFVAGGLSWVLRSLAPGTDAAAPSPPTRPAAAVAASGFALELPLVGDGLLVDREPVDPTGEPPRPTGGDSIAHLDTGSPGRGGESRTPVPALNLADRDERMRLSPDLVSHLDRDQLQRLRVARARQSWEDRRSTTHPAELTLVVTGTGSLMERRPAAAVEPSRGTLQPAVASVRGGDLGAPALDPDADRRRGGAQLGSIDGAPGAGVFEARPGVDHRASAPVGSARPDVARAAVAVPALEPARPRDNVDSEQEVATLVRSLVHASSAGGLAGEGQGGAGGGGAAAAGGASGAGSRARPMGFGDGDRSSSPDPHYLSYVRRIKSQIYPYWADAFPKSALYDLRQGTVIIEFTVFADGHTAVSWPPARPSGIDEFDRNCAEAIRRASPLPPIPRELGVDRLKFLWPFTIDNPVVR